MLSLCVIQVLPIFSLKNTVEGVESSGTNSITKHRYIVNEGALKQLLFLCGNSNKILSSNAKVMHIGVILSCK